MSVVPRIPLIEDLTTGPIPPGSNLLVEFMGASQWYNASLTIAAGWMKKGGKVAYNALAHSPDDIRSRLTRLGLNVEELEKGDKLRIVDLYTPTLGQKSKEKYSVDSMKVADMSIRFSRNIMRQPAEPEWLRITDNTSTMARFNDEKAFVEFLLTRSFPNVRLRKLTGISALVRGVHSGWVYEQLEAAADGVVDLKVEEVGEERINLIGIRSMQNAGFDSRWHRLKIGENFEVSLER